jgi:hypothetical protein
MNLFSTKCHQCNKMGGSSARLCASHNLPPRPPPHLSTITHACAPHAWTRVDTHGHVRTCTTVTVDLQDSRDHDKYRCTVQHYPCPAGCTRWNQSHSRHDPVRPDAIFFSLVLSFSLSRSSACALSPASVCARGCSSPSALSSFTRACARSLSQRFRRS